MSDNAWKTGAEQVVAEAAQDVLETMFFAMIGEEAELPEEQPEVVGARVDFQGTWTGSLKVSLPRESIRTIAVDFLGLDDEEELTDSQQDAVMGELVNMICGSVLSRLDTEGDFRLDSPKLLVAAEDTGEQADLYITLPLDTGLLRLSLAVNSQSGT